MKTVRVAIDIWEEDWFLEMNSCHKLFVYYLFSKSNIGGVWKPNKILAERILGCKLDLDEILEDINEDKERIKVLQNGRWLLVEFFTFQYGTKLKMNNRFHISVKDIWDKNDINPSEIGVDIVEVDMGESIGSGSTKPLTKEQKEERLNKKKNSFIKDVAEFKETYHRDILNDFVEYWTEPNKSKTQLRWEMEPTFDVKRRLARFDRNDFNNRKGK